MDWFVSPKHDSTVVAESSRETLFPHFQPIVTSGNNNSLFAVEALLRLPNMPNSCEALVKNWEISGEIPEIDILMVRRVTETLREAAFNLPLSVGVNVSALTIARTPDQYLRELEHLTDAASSVIVEITETYPIYDFDALLYFTRKCAALGIYIALDDCRPQHQFSTPSLVSSVRPDIIKIDGPLLHQCYDQQIVEPVTEIIRLAQSIDAVVVAEHIESQSMAEWAYKLGAGFIQGYYIGIPQPLRGEGST